MTVYVDPVIGAAVVHLGLPILPGLPCPTCAGRSEFRDDMFGSSPCPDCTDGVWTPPAHPVPIGVTSATADAMLDQDERMHEAGYDIGIISDQRSGWELATRPPGEEWTSGNTIKHPIVLSSMIGEGTLRKVKVHDWDHEPEDDPGIWLEGRPGHIIGLVLQDDSLAETDISSALPFLPGLKPGDTLYLADGFTESVECPECHGYCCLPIRLGSDGLFGGGGQCSACAGTGQLSCPFPVDAPDHPCVQP